MRTLSRIIQAFSLAVVTVLTSGCASVRPPPPPIPAELFADARFQAPPVQPNADELFSVSPAMRAYLHSPKFTREIRANGAARGLVDALYMNGELKLEYDSSMTRNAAETFDARMGNCLSLVIMTAAFARELGLTVQFQDVAIDQVWTRTGGMYFANTHVNVSIGTRLADPFQFETGNRVLTIDFIPAPDAGSLRAHQIDEETIVSMYMNNRAAELLAEGKTDAAYWWARNALQRNPGHMNLYNTLAVIYQRHGDLAQAEQVFKAGLTREPENLNVLHNLVPVLKGLGKEAEAGVLTARLARIDPRPPFYYFALGQKAMLERRWEDAKMNFIKEVRRSPYSHEFHFWLAMAQLQLGEISAAREQLTQARETSTTKANTQRYTDKLAHLRMLTARQY